MIWLLCKGAREPFGPKQLGAAKRAAQESGKWTQTANFTSTRPRHRNDPPTAKRTNTYFPVILPKSYTRKVMFLRLLKRNSPSHCWGASYWLLKLESRLKVSALAPCAHPLSQTWLFPNPRNKARTSPLTLGGGNLLTLKSSKCVLPTVPTACMYTRCFP